MRSTAALSCNPQRTTSPSEQWPQEGQKQAGLLTAHLLPPGPQTTAYSWVTPQSPLDREQGHQGHKVPGCPQPEPAAAHSRHQAGSQVPGL